MLGRGREPHRVVLDTHKSTLAAAPEEQMGLEREGEQGLGSGRQGSGYAEQWDSRSPLQLEDSPFLPSQVGKKAICLWQGNLWPPKDPWDHSHPQGRHSRLLPQPSGSARI